MRVNSFVLMLLIMFISMECANTVSKEKSAVYLGGKIISGIDELHLLSLRGDIIHTIEPNSNQEFQSKIGLETEGYYYLKGGDQLWELYLYPGDSLYFQFESKGLDISGIGSDRNMFIQKRNSEISDVLRRFYDSDPSPMEPEEHLNKSFSKLKQEAVNIKDHSQFATKEVLELDYQYLDKVANRKQNIEQNPKLKSIFREELIRIDNLEIANELALNNSLHYLDLAATAIYLKGLPNGELNKIVALINDPGLKNHFMESLSWKICSKELMHLGESNFDYADAMSSIVDQQPDIYSQQVHEIINTYSVYRAAEGQQASFNYENSEGQKVSLKEFEGKYVLIHFWASWCGPCMAELPELSEFMNKFDSNDIQLVGISIDRSDKKHKWKKKINSNKLLSNHIQLLAPWQGYPEKDDIKDEFVKMIHLNGWYVGIPHYTLIDPNGKIMKARFYRDFDKAEAYLSKLLKS